MPRVRASSLVLLAAALGARAAPARADGGLEVVPLEGGSWAAQIAALQTLPQPPGAGFHVRVVEDDTRRVVACGRYTLALDDAGAQALALGACDPTTGATLVTLVDRAALFAPGDPVPLPRVVSIGAIAVRQGGSAGGAARQGGVELRCTAAVRPFVRDLLHGTAVYLTPDRFRVEPLDARVRADAVADLWTVSVARSNAVASAAFRVVDASDGREVLRSRVALQCHSADGIDTAPPAPRAVIASRATGTAAAPFALPAGAVGRGSTVGGAGERLTCAEAPGATVIWRFVAPSDGTYEVLLQGSYDTTLEVREAVADGAPRPLACNDDNGVPHHSRVVARLQRGRSYDLAVGGHSGQAGRYEIAALPILMDAEVTPTPEGARVIRIEP